MAFSPTNIKTQPDPHSKASPTLDKNHTTRKRKRTERDDVVDIRDSAYFKIRALLQHLRPCFVEVLRTPDFQNCNAATEIHTGMKLVMDLYKHMQIEGKQRGKREKSASQPILPDRKEDFNGLLQERTQEEGNQPKEANNELAEKKLIPPQVPEETAEKKLIPPQVPEEKAERKLSATPSSSEKNCEGGKLQGSYIVGGSAPGWNFITHTNRRPSVYYGITKESFRSSRTKKKTPKATYKPILNTL